MNFRRLISHLTLAATMGLTLVATPASAARLDPLTAAATAGTATLTPARARMNQRVFDQVWNEVRASYYDPRLHGVDWTGARRTYRAEALAATSDRALYRVLDQMLDLLDDDHASAQSPAVARRNDTLRQRRPVMGLTLRRDEDDVDLYTIEGVRDGSPAQEAGVEDGWRLNVGGADTWFPEMDVAEGRPVSLALVDADGAPRPLVLTPRVMDPKPAFVADRSRPGVAVLRVEGFEQGLGRWIGDQLAQLEPDTDVILDLRGNAGGRLMEADAVLSCFLPRDRVWATRTSRNGRRIPMRTEGGCGDLKTPAVNDVAVLVDGESRSAAELTPAALQEAGRAVVVGEPTAGAVLISQETRLPDGGKLTLSRADFVTSGGVRLEKRGVTPDVLAAKGPEDRRAGRDPALDAAIAALAHRTAAPERVQSAAATAL